MAESRVNSSRTALTYDELEREGGRRGTHNAIPVSADELARLHECEARCVWLLPIVTGVESTEVGCRIQALATALASGLDGNAAVDAARKMTP